jgi:hypothetical protein
MDHATAIETHAAERYLLGELIGSEAEMFEEHYFDCAVCAEDIRDGARFMDVGRDLVRNDPKQQKPRIQGPVRRRSQGGWMSLAAAAILVLGVGLGMVMPEPGADKIYATPPYQTGINRGAEKDVFRVHEPITVGHDFDEGKEFFVEIHAKENVIRRQKLEPELRNTNQFITTGELPAGVYEMRVISVHADGNREVTKFPFKVVE